MGYNDTVEFSSLIGKTISYIEAANGYAGGLCIRTTDGCEYWMGHHRSCCESVSIEDISGGTLHDLVGQPILEAYSESSTTPPEGVEADDYGAQEWTFYRIRTNLNTIVIRWYGTSNGYYGTEVDFELVSQNVN